MKFREHILTSGTEIILGKDSKNNDELVEVADSKDILLHTSQPGSPFCNVGKSPSAKDLKEAAIFCASRSQDWRDNKKDVVVDIFRRSNMNKDKKMKQGTWGVKKKEKQIKVKKSEILGLK